MIMGANQPYFMPYIGYWQLINAVDIFVICDDYNYINSGWINRNRILRDGQAKYINIEIHHASQNKKINQLLLSDVYDCKKKLLQLREAYQKAPYFEQGYELMCPILEFQEKDLACFLEHSMRCVCDYLGITTPFIRSSSIAHNAELRREYRIIDQCRHVGADVYINAIGGQQLYSYKQFAEEGIKLGFLKCGDIRYKQYGADFVSNLSIIDLIMFNSQEEIQQMLQNYTVLWEEKTDDMVVFYE